MEQEDPRQAYAQLAGLGVMLLCSVMFYPYLDGVGYGTDGGALDTAPRMLYKGTKWINDISWLGVSCITSVVAYGVVMSKRVPRKVADKFADHKGFLARAHRSDILGAKDTSKPRRRKSTH